MKIKVGLSSLRIYKNLPYTFWGAVGEFVDNSIQAYLDEEKVLKKKLKKAKEKLTIRIDFDSKTKILKISDNSTGIKRARLEQAFDIGSEISDRNDPNFALGQFNIGMKAAAIWLCEEWEICTKRHDSDKELSLSIINEDVFAEKDDIPEQEKKIGNVNKHYTLLSFEKLNQVPNITVVNKTKLHLASMYRRFLGKSIDIIWNGESLTWEEPILMKHPNGKPFKWNFGPATSPGDERNREIRGWVGVLELESKGGTAGRDRAGISVIRRNRVIQGPPNAWRPKEIYASGAGSTINQRIVGEIEFDEGDVTFDKTAISINDLDVLGIYLGQLVTDYDIKRKAQEGSKGQDEDKPVDAKEDKKDLDAIKGSVQNSNLDKITESSIPPTDRIKARIERAFKNAKSTDKTTFKIGNFKLILLAEYKNESIPFVAYKSDKKNEIKVLVNMQHPYITKHYITRNEYFQFIILMVVARYKIEINSRLSMDDYFEVLDDVMRLEINRKN